MMGYFSDTLVGLFAWTGMVALVLIALEGAYLKVTSKVRMSDAVLAALGTVVIAVAIVKLGYVPR